jgi:hypothetical protein
MIDNININIEIAQHTSNLTLETNFLSSLSPIVAAVLEVEVSSVRNPTPAARRCQENPILKMAQHLWKKQKETYILELWDTQLETFESFANPKKIARETN